MSFSLQNKGASSTKFPNLQFIASFLSSCHRFLALLLMIVGTESHSFFNEKYYKLALLVSLVLPDTLTIYAHKC